MNYNCKHYRTRTQKSIKYGYCLNKNKIVPLFCKECEEYKKTIKEKQKDLNWSKSTKLKNTTSCYSSKQLCQKSKELAKLEKNRFSILGSTKNKCFLCPSKTDLTWHEVYRGKNRTNSMKYGLCLRLCYNCHEKYQEDKDFNSYWHKQAQIIFNITYPNLNFLEIFKRNYL